MKVVQVSAPREPFELAERPVPEVAPNEVLLRVEACGICHGDALAKDGGFVGTQYPRVPGHEIVGRVVKRGENVDAWEVGARVGVGWHGGHCGKCTACRRGQFGACAEALTTGLSTDGGYAEFTTARADVAIALPDDVPAASLAPLLCAGNTTFSAILELTRYRGHLRTDA